VSIVIGEVLDNLPQVHLADVDSKGCGFAEDLGRPNLTTGANTDNAARKCDSTDDPDFIRGALRTANPNVLRIVLLHLTRDPALRCMRLEQKPVRGGALTTYAVAPEHHEELYEKAFQYLTDPRSIVAPPPSAEEARDLMELFSQEKLSDQQFQFGLEELAFEQFPRDVQWGKKPDAKRLETFHVAVIGAGISGIATAIQLSRMGIPYTVIERQSDIGGTWQLNHYPEARVDTNHNLYQFKFEHNYPWTELFPSRDETKKYLKHCAAKYGVVDNFRLNTELRSARWDESSSKWILGLNDNGQSKTLAVNAVISCSGLFSTPNLPDIPGIESFGGRIFHTAAWDHSYDYAGKRIGLIGTGSSGVQLMPHLAAKAKHLTIFQRTPHWISQMENYRSPVTPELRWLFNSLPYYSNWYSYSCFYPTTQMQYLQTFDSEWQKAGGIISKGNDKLREVFTQYIMGKVGQRPDLVKKCVPSYAPLGRRLVVDNGWYDALLLENVELVVDGIDHIAPSGIVSNDGKLHELDFIVLGAGFQATKYLWPVPYIGRHGITLEQSWKKDGARAYLGITMPGFPNFFMFYGPNGQPRGAGFYSWAEIWARYSVKAIVTLLETGSASLEVKQTVFDEYNRKQDEAMRPIIWEKEGLRNYYLNEQGRQAVNMPWLMHEYHAWVRSPNMSDFDVR
jgi:4-hydroxyacetophenone monooxygenase